MDLSRDQRAGQVFLIRAFFFRGNLTHSTKASEKLYTPARMSDAALYSPMHRGDFSVKWFDSKKTKKTLCPKGLKIFHCCLLPRFSLRICFNVTECLTWKINVKNVNSDLISVIILKFFKHENHQLYIAPCTEFKVINVGSNTFGNPIFHEGLQN